MIEASNPLLPDYFRLHAKWRSDRPALIADGQTLNWKQFNSRLNQVANGLHSEGVLRGKTAVIFMDNGQAMAEILFGLMKAGVASAPINLSVGDEAIRAMILDCGADAIFVSAPYADRIKALLETLGDDAPSLRICDEDTEGWESYRSWRDQQSESEPDVDIQPNDILNIIYSSGTTGQPK